MLGEAISSLPLRLSVTVLTIGSRHGHQAVWDAALSPLAQRPADGRAQGARSQDGLAASGDVAGAPADPRVSRRHRPGDEGRRPADPGVDTDRTGAGGAQGRAAPLPLWFREAR